MLVKQKELQRMNAKASFCAFATNLEFGQEVFVVSNAAHNLEASLLKAHNQRSTKTMWGHNSAFKKGQALAAQIAKQKGLEVPLSTKNKKSASISQQTKQERPPALVNASLTSEPSVATMPDDLSTDSFSDAPTLKAPAVVSNHKAQDMIKSLQQISEQQQELETQLDERIKEQKTLAKARQVNDNTMGALLCMKKIHQLQVERARSSLAYDIALEGIVDLQSALNSAQSKAVAEQGKSAGWFKLDLDEDTANVLGEVHAVLNGQDMDVKPPTKDELLAALNRL